MELNKPINLAEKSFQEKVDRCRRNILHSTFFDLKKIRENISTSKKLGKHIESELTAVKPKNTAPESLELVKKILKNKIIYGVISFYDHYNIDWLKYFYKLYDEDDKSNLLKFIESDTASDTFFRLTSFLIEGKDSYTKTCILGHRFLNGDSDSIGHHEDISEDSKFNQEMKNIATIKNNGTSYTKDYILGLKDKNQFEKFIENYQVTLEKNNLQNIFGIDIDGLEKEENNKGKQKIIQIENLFKFLFTQKKTNGWKFLYCFTPTYKLPGGVIFIYTKNRLNNNFVDLIQLLANQLFLQLSMALNIVKAEKDLQKHYTRIAIISILVDSFAHNISAHSLLAMVWFLKQQRQKPIDSDLPYDICKKTFSDLKKGIENSAGKQHLLNLISEIDNNFVKIAPMEGSVQYAQYICNKAAFWSGVTRDFECGGEIRSWYDVLKDFVENSIYLGTIAHAEGIHKVKINVGYKGSSCKELKEFCAIDLSYMFEGTEKVKNKGVNDSFKEELSKDEWRLFLPNGIVGLHALYTIFENTLRNIKHADPNELDNAKNDGIEFNIFIESVDNKHFNTTIWLGNKSKIMEERKNNEGNVVKDENGNAVKDGVDERIRNLLEQNIVTDNGTPRMGGNSQDKICASMLYNNIFSKVDVNDQDNPKRAYRWWIGVKRDPENGQELGVIKRSFDVWKGRDKVEIVPDGNQEDKPDIIKVSDLKYENPARFKFVIVPKSEENSESESGEDKQGSKGDLAKKGIVRIMEKSECSGDDLDSLYKAWNKKWIKADRNVVTVLGKGTTTAFTVIHDGTEWKHNHSNNNLGCDFSELNKNYSFVNDKDYSTISFKHRGDSKEGDLEYANHGVFIERFLSEKGYFIKGEMKDEFTETLLTNIEIYDNRIFDRVYSCKKKNILTTKLFLCIYNENIYTDEEKKELQLKAKDIKSKANFIIIHLSYIESLGFKEENINKFIEEYFKDFLGDNSKLVITTGRGRGEWHNRIDEKYKPHVLFKPIDSLLAAVEDGLMLNDDFQVKYNLVKILFGS